MSRTPLKVRPETHTGKKALISGVTSLNGNRLFKITYEKRAGYVRQTEFAMDKGVARRQLLTSGVVITSEKDWGTIVKAIEEVSAFSQKALIEAPGWCAPYYAEANGFVHSPKGLRRGRAIFAPPGGGASISGTHAEWLELVAIPLTGQNLPMLSVLIAFASPMLRFFEKLNFGIEFWGPPARGKTTLLSLMTSVARNPTAMASFNSTQAGLEKLFRQAQDMPFAIDEANLIPHNARQSQRDFTFRMSNGTVRLTAFESDQAHYRFIYATSANRPFHDVVGSIDRDTDSAAFQRLLSLRVKDDELGIFDFLPAGYSSSGAFATHLTEAMHAQYGTAYREFLRHLINVQHSNPTKFADVVKRRVGRFERATGVAETIAGQSRASKFFGLLFAAGDFAQARGVIPSEWDCMKACLACYRNYQAQLPSHTPLAARLATIVDRPETLHLGSDELPVLNDRAFRRAGAFVRKGVKGRTELLVSREYRREHLKDWERLKTTPEFDRWNLGRGRRKEVQRQVRAGKGKEWFACFKLPAGLDPREKKQGS